MSQFYTCDNFITDGERFKILDDVFALRDKWKQIHPDLHKQYGILKEGFCHLGNSLYVSDMTQDPMDFELKELLIEKFGWIHQRIFDNITSRTGKSCVIHDKLGCPGFHIINLEPNYRPSYHTDTSILQYHNIDPYTIRSCNLLLQMPNGGASLDYIEDIERNFKYKYNQLAEWSGLMRHRIGKLNTTLTDFRISLQCHYFYDSKSDTNVIYF